MDWKKLGSDLRKHLLTGVSYMIPFVVPGGILIALGFLFGGIYVFKTPGPLADIFNLGKTAFGLMVPALAAYIAFSISDRPGIAPGFVAGMVASNIGAGFIGGIIGGLLAGYFVNWIKTWPMPVALKPLMPVLVIPLVGTGVIGLVMLWIIGPPVTWLNNTMTATLNGMSAGSLIILGLIQGFMLAFDMGGPVNKAAYAFALALSANGNWGPMAANFVASMSPPMGIAIAILIANNRFTQLERKGISGCVVGGLCMITEFAIPYAAGDPIRVIPSLMVGSGVGAALCYVFGLTLSAPHGGFFVILLANNPLLWIFCFAVASFVTAGMLVALKPKLSEKEAEEMEQVEALPSITG